LLAAFASKSKFKSWKEEIVNGRKVTAYYTSNHKLPVIIRVQYRAILFKDRVVEFWTTSDKFGADFNDALCFKPRRQS